MRRLLLGLAASFLVISGCTASTGPATGSDGEVSQPAPSERVADSPSPSQTAGTPIRVLDFTLDPLTLSLAGPAIALTVTNDGPTVHNVAVRDVSGTILITTADLHENEAETITTQVAPGTYDLICTLPGHESLGIKGTLMVAP